MILLQYQHKFLPARIGRIYPPIHDLQFSMICEVVTNFLSFQVFRKYTQTDNLVVLVEEDFYLVAELIADVVAASDADVAVAVVLD